MTYNIITEQEYILKENYLMQVIENVIRKSKFNFTNQLCSFYFTNQNNYSKTIKSINPLKNPTNGGVVAVGQFLYVNNKYSIILNYENKYVSNYLESNLIHELTHFDNHLIFSQKEELNIILNKFNNFTDFEIYTFKCLDIIDEYIATRNESFYGYNILFEDFKEELTCRINYINETITNDKIKIQKEEFLKTRNRRAIAYNIFLNLVEFLTILSRVLPLKQENDLFPVISNSNINSFVPELKKLLEETYQNYLNDKTSIIYGVENLENLLLSLFDDILEF